MTASRFTFHRPAGEVAWQRQQRDRYADEGTPDGVDLSLKRAKIVPVSRKVANRIIAKYEWLGTISQHASYFYAIKFGNHVGGVTCVSIGSGGPAPGVYKTFGFTERNELAYLCRGACVHWAPKGANSKLVAWTCRILTQTTPSKLVVAYADTDAGEIGTIYQACGWTYVGPGGVTTQWVSPRGVMRNQHILMDLVRDRGGTSVQWAKVLRNAGWTEQKTNPKHRYIQFLGSPTEALKQRIDEMSGPYPKRQSAGSIADDAPAHQRGEGGSIPTPALQE